MQVSYGHFTGRVSEFKLEAIDEWIISLLKDGDTEEQLERQAALLGVIGTHLLAKHPELVGEMAVALSCAGDNHRIVEDDR